MLRKSDAAKLRVTRGEGNRGEHGQLAGKQHQHLDRCGGAARLRLGKGRDTGSVAIHLEKDAYRQGASEIGIQGAAVSGKGMTTEKHKDEKKKNNKTILIH